MMMIRRWTLVGVMIAVALAVGCQRTPEDLEQWRGTRGGLDQLSEWASSDRESVPVRVRALQIIIEEGEGERVPRVLDRVEDQELRTELADGAFSAVQAKWEVGDLPEFTEELRAGGGVIVVGQAAQAKDLAYQLHPYLGETRAQAEAIMREWMSDEQELRTQIGGARIPMLVPRAGEGAMELLADWIKTAHDPRQVVEGLRQVATEEGEKRAIDEAVAERAEAEHPELSRELQHAVVGATTDAIAPYLERAIMDPAIAGDFLQGSLDTLVEVRGAEAGEFLARVVAERDGVLRWAAANALIDARDDAGLVDIARSLPTDAGAYASGAEDSLRRYITQICNYYGLAVERRELADHEASLRAVLEVGTWPAQLLFVQCVGRTEAAALADEVDALRSSRQQLPRWGERKTLGQLAAEVHGGLE